MAAAAADDDVHALNVVAGPQPQVAADLANISAQEYIARLIEGLAAQVALMETEFLNSEHREIKLRELLQSTEILLNEYKELYRQVNQAFETVSGELGRMRRNCVCGRGPHALSRT